MDTYAYHYYLVVAFHFLHFIHHHYTLRISSRLHAAELHSAFLRLAVIYACDFTAAKNVNKPKILVLLRERETLVARKG